MAINKPQAIQWKYSIQCAEVNGVLKDFSSPLTEEQINTAVSEYEVHLDSTQYQRDRAAEYPNAIECVHALLDGGDTLTDLQAQRTAIKDKYPKS